LGTEISVVYNNLPGASRFITDWGVSYLVRSGGRKILFDTGGNPVILRENLRRLGADPEEIDAVVLSHYHLDHIGGLGAVFKPGLKIFLLPLFPEGFKERLRSEGAVVIEADRPRPVAGEIWTTGEIKGYIPEQSLIIKTDRGAVVLIGCSHPGVEKICRRARQAIGGKIYLVSGGFHLGGSSREEIKNIIQGLKSIGVEKIAPNHCTGSLALRMFMEAWGDDFIHLGVGETVNIDDIENREIKE